MLNHSIRRSASLLFILFSIGCAKQIQTTSAKDLLVLKETGYLPVVVVRISDEYANINTNLGEAVLTKIGITEQTIFKAHFQQQTIQALLGKDYSDVPRGAWVALIEEDGNMQLAISFGNAATELGCAVGDTLYIEPPTVSN